MDNNQVMKKSFAILISSSDSYLDVLDIFFRFFVVNNNTKVPIYLNLENDVGNDIVSKYSHLNLIPIVYDRPKYFGFWLDWSDRFSEALKNIKEDYILHLLDDFFIYEKIRFDRIYFILNEMSNNNIFSVQLDYRLTTDKEVPEIMTITDTWLCSFQPTIWKTEFLFKLLRKHESIWAFEKFSSQRSKRLGFSKFFGTVKNVKIYNFIRDDRISAIVMGKSWIVRL
jgi:hypothetical protein